MRERCRAIRADPCGRVRPPRSDPDCEGHRCDGGGAYDQQPYDGEESPEEDSCSEHSSSTSTSTNQKEGKYCDCCYCEFFGHGGPPAAPTSRNYAEMREKLRLRLTKRKEEQPKKDDPLLERDGVEDHRKVEDLLQFINSADSKPTSSSKAAKRARHKQKKLEEKARLEAEAREREEEQRRREEEEEALKQELLRLQELQQLRAAKKKKKDKAKEVQKPAPAPVTTPQPLKESAQNVLENLKNGKTQLLHNLIGLPSTPEPAPSRPHSPKTGKEGPAEAPALPEAVSQRDPNGNGKLKPKQPTAKVVTETAKKPDLPKGVEAALKAVNGTPAEPKVKPRPVEEPAPEAKREERNGGPASRKQLNHVKEERAPPVAEPAPATEPPQQNGKPASAESPQPKGKARKNKKKKGEKMNNSIDDVFLPKDIDLDSVEMDETEREVEYFKRFCLDSARQTRQRLSINWSNFSLKKATYAAH
ncbi:hypothetical protein MATL_G00222470 [Megalops atlanticus]|uniref:FAM193 C-terminal domain-containing protein n=1 Tax=Megalops atlanticus TaxID=7932 RepID=A0A9D3PI82_MEGAT|nr:hypothetical protein MATL_G00222470 [Megalops atlanticus]